MSLEDPDQYTPYQKLWEQACWTFPLFSYEVTGDLDLLGEVTAIGDKHDYSPGPMEYWCKEFDSGTVAILQHPINPSRGYNFLTIYANHIDIDRLIKELDLPFVIDWRADEHPDGWNEVKQFFQEKFRWRVLRYDDNDNQFVIQSNMSEVGAKAMAYRFEKRGHKQIYWVEDLAKT